ncbi:hypothetical protein FBU30_003369 [Linnemannia zychae]|nr:hypothetical protein FBU30_003369 [Linnemannia zychae]
MSFIYNYFCSSSTMTPSEKENAAALKAMIKSHKSALKAEFKQHESTCKNTIKDAEAEYRRVKKQAEETMYRNILDAVNREIEIVMTTDEYMGADEKTKSKLVQFQEWIGCAGQKCHGSDGNREKDVKEVVFDMKEHELPSYQDDANASVATNYPAEKDASLAV